MRLPAILMFIAQLVVAVPAPAAPHGFLPGRAVASTPASIRFAREFGSRLDCRESSATYKRLGFPRGKDVSAVRAIEALVRTRFSYTSDPAGRDNWQNLGPRLLKQSGKTVRGDCEDLAISVMALAICAGVPAENIGLAMIQTTAGSLSVAGTDHMVGLMRSQNGGLIVFGDTRGRTSLAPSDQIFATITARGLMERIPKWRVAIPLPKGTLRNRQALIAARK